MDKNLFGLLCFGCFIIIAISEETEFKEYKAVKIHKKVFMVFAKAIDKELLPNGKYMYNPLKEIENYEVYLTSHLGDFIEFCVEVLKEFDENLVTKPSEVIFLSFYYKMLRWLDYHLHQIQNVKQVFHSGLNDLINEIIVKRQFSGDIIAAFDTKIYEVKVPKELTAFGEELDQAIKLIYEIDSRYVQMHDEHHKFEDGREKFNALICCYIVNCKKIEVYENFLRKLNNGEDYSNYEVSHRQLELIGVIDIVLITFSGGYKRAIDYDEINLSKYTRGTVAYLKYAALLFIKAAEKCVFHELGELIDVAYDYQKAYIENFSTRDKAFYLRLCGLNGQVSLAVHFLWETYVKNFEKMQNEQIKKAFYRLLIWLSKYAKFRACSYTDDKINEILPIMQVYAPVTDEDILKAGIPRGVSTVKELIEFGKSGKIEAKPFTEEDDNNDTFVPEKEPLENAEIASDEKIDDSWSDDPSDIEDVEIIHVNENSSDGKAHSTNNLLQNSLSFSNLQSWIGSIGSLIGPSLSNIKDKVIEKLKTYNII